MAQRCSVLPVLMHIFQVPQITEAVMAAMGVQGPFVMIGSMDNGHERVLQYALDHPDNVVAIVPVSFSNYSEFVGPMTYYNIPQDEMVETAKQTAWQRLMIGDFSNFVGVSFGLIELLAKPSSVYVPADRALEATFLNLYNEKQWVTNSNFLYGMYVDPVEAGQFSPSLYYTHIQYLDPRVRVIGYAYGQTEDDIENNCAAQGKTDDACAYDKWIYNAEMEFNEESCSQTPNSKLIVCWPHGEQANGCPGEVNSAFFLDQYANIPWFAETLMDSLKDLAK
jgi:hypothetical protein